MSSSSKVKPVPLSKPLTIIATAFPIAVELFGTCMSWIGKQISSSGHKAYVQVQYAYVKKTKTAPPLWFVITAAVLVAAVIAGIIICILEFTNVWWWVLIGIAVVAIYRVIVGKR